MRKRRKGRRERERRGAWDGEEERLLQETQTGVLEPNLPAKRH